MSKINLTNKSTYAKHVFNFFIITKKCIQVNSFTTSKKRQKIQLTYFFKSATKSPVTNSRAISEKRQHLKTLFCSQLPLKTFKTKITTASEKANISK